jgi:hypothetical protein
MGRLILTVATAGFGLMAAAMLHAQLLGPVGDAVGSVARLPGDVLGEVARPVGGALRSAADLATQRLSRLRLFAERNRDAIELDPQGEPAVRGVVIAVDPGEEALRKATAAGFALIRDERIAGLDIRSVTLGTPKGWTLRKAMAELRRIAPEGDFTPNHILLPSGAAASGGRDAPLATGKAGASPIGLIDGGVARHPSLGAVEQQGFAAGAPAASAHGTAVASLIAGQGRVRGGSSGSALLVADVYGRDPAGGNALAIARAIGWMASRRAPVVTISLVGPANPLLARAVAVASARGMAIVAAVGNDGAAAPPAYPASYPEVIAVTGVDGRDRPLIEAGRALHLDYAAPGADMTAAALNGGVTGVRGTSFAAPLVAGRLALHYTASEPSRRAAALAALDREARDLGPPGPDRLFGRGLVCGDCRNPAKAPAGRTGLSQPH